VLNRIVLDGFQLKLLAENSFWMPAINPRWSFSSKKYCVFGHYHPASSNRLSSGIIGVEPDLLDGF
jgi:hypothetical protein